MSAPGSEDEAPKLDFDWEEGLFRAGRAIFRRLRRRSTDDDDEAATFVVDGDAALTAFARVLSGADLRIRRTAGVGGLRGRDVVLPERIHCCDDAEVNRAILNTRVAIAAGLHLRRPWPPQTPGDIPLLYWLQLCSETIQKLRDDFPMFGELYDPLPAVELSQRPAPDTLRGRARYEEEARRSALAGGEPWRDEALRQRLKSTRPSKDSSPEIALWGRLVSVDSDVLGSAAADDQPEAVDGTESEALQHDDIRVLLLDEKDAQELPVHVFEKVETLENWQGGMRQMDGTDELDDHLEALDEVDMRDLVRGGEQAQSLLKADIALDIEIPDVSRIDPEERGVTYDEWNRRRRRYRKDWATVYPTALSASAPAWAAEVVSRRRKQIDDLTSRLVRHRHELRAQKRQLDGEDVDIDALVDELSSVRAGHGGNQRLYIRETRQRRDFATTVLLDISLSTDSWVDDKRVLDVARESVAVLGEVTDALGDRLRVIAFASHTRNQIRAFDVLRWDEPWQTGAARLGTLKPQGYTRIGPALRHAIADLKSVDAKHRLLLLVSDGKPTDYDRYEGRYGVSDIRQAVREARAEQIHVHALAIESAARDYLPAMLGNGAWHLMPRAEELIETMTTIYGRLTG